jgi:hypothetical protein
MLLNRQGVLLVRTNNITEIENRLLTIADL